MTTHAGFAATLNASSVTHETAAVTVVICAYTDRRWPELSRAVASVLAQHLRPDQVILVIDHNDALLDRATRSFPDVTVVPNTGPRGLSGARNSGLARARGDVVAFVDDDAEAEPGWLIRLVRHYGNPAVMAVGGSAVPVWDGRRPRWLPPEFDWVVGCSFTGQPVRAAPVRNLIGCNMSFRRAALQDIDGFHPALGRVGTVPVGCEETELCIRLHRRHPGGVVLYDPAARVRHRVSADRATWSYFRRRCFSEGRSKAVVARMVGTRSGLSAEREYTRRALPRAVRRELRGARTGPAALLRVGAIVAGLLVTGSGYLTGRVGRVADAASETKPARFAPVRVLAVELSDGVPALSDGERVDERRYTAARVLVRRHGRPLGVLDLDLPPGGLSAEAHAELIARRLGPAVTDGPASPVSSPDADRAPYVTVVVPTCGREHVLRRTLDALAALDYPCYEVLVVDNAPQRPGTAVVVRERAAAGMQVRYASEPRRGVAYARNRGLAEARGAIVAYADDDVVVDRGWLRALVDGFGDEAVAAVTGYVLPAELETPAQVWVEQYGGFGKGCVRRRFDRTGYDLVRPDRVERVAAGPGSLYPYLPGTYGSGANMAFRAEVLRQLGGFDPALGGGGAVRAGEDIDALLRLVLTGHAVVYEPSAMVWHTHKRELRALRSTVYHYGVGLSAVLTKRLVTDRRGRQELLRRVPRGIAYAVRPGSAKNAGKRYGYPFSLTIVELWGMASGPVRYAWSAWATRAGGRRS